jgi:vanillate O-demethylase monooxygenase subunit
LKHAWYVAAWDHEVGRELRAATILGERIALYRTEGGAPVALEDACPHRKMPLSLGRLVGDAVECGYHGLTFDCSGRCTRAPGGARIPPAARVRSYPVVSRYGLVWIWMGAAERADPARIFKLDHSDDPSWGRNDGDSMHIACDYLYMTDNLLDPSHVAWVHRSSLGNAAAAEEPVQTAVNADGVTAFRWMRDVEVVPFYVPFVRFAGRCDRLQHYEVRYPSHALIRAVFVPAGHGGEHGAGHPQAMIMDSYNFMTPVDADNTRYFWFQLRNFAPQDPEVSRIMGDGLSVAFREDKVVLEAVHQGFKHQTTPNLYLAIDRAPLLFRQRLTQLIGDERPIAAATG